MPKLHPAAKDNPDISSPEYTSVTPHDSDDLKYRARMVMCSGAGDISFQNGGSATVMAIPANTPIPMQFDRINSTGTNATGIIAWF